ncbi:MAG: hypothetical protein AB8G05_17980 [Oligoflexales bacterium]
MQHRIILFCLFILSSSSFASSENNQLKQIRDSLRVDLCSSISNIYVNFFDTYTDFITHPDYNITDVLFNENMRNHPGNKLLLELIYRIQSRFHRYCEIHLYKVPNCIYCVLKSSGSEFKEFNNNSKKWITVSQERAEELIGFYFVKFFTFFEVPSK